jgi:branched-chain amino acid transport system substrate-binding protein
MVIHVLRRSLRRSSRRASAFLGLFLFATALHAEIVIGQVAPFSGPQAVTGRAIRAGAKLYFDSVNAGGGVHGQKIRFVTQDDEQKPELTVRAVDDMIRTQSPVALLGTVGTTNLEALAKDGVLQRSKVPMVGAISGSTSVAKAPGMLVVKASYRDEVDRAFAILSNLNVRRVGVVYQDDSLGKDMLAGADASAARRGIDLVVRAGYPRNTTDTSVAVDKMLQASPQAIFLGATTAAAIDFMERYHRLGGKAPIYGMSIIDIETVLSRLGTEGAHGYAFSSVLPLQSQEKLPIVREYQALRAASHDPDLSGRSIEGYIAAKALVWALSRSPRTGPGVLEATLSVPGGFDLGGFRLDFSRSTGFGSHLVDFAMLGKGGKIVQ